ncbi:MAG: peptidase S8/S53 subtilisin kexin sedolisin [Candidatus Limnocylindrales bacterium]
MRRLVGLVVFGFLVGALIAPTGAAAAGLPQLRAHTLLRVHNQAGSTAPSGMAPGMILGAYGFSSSPTAGSGRTIAIVDAYDDPNAEADLGVFDNTWGLPACTTANGCFKKVSQSGGTKYPAADAGWSLEIALDVEWAHAIAPGAHILLVEASTPSLGNLLTAENYAKAHAKYVSNSWGTGEFSFERFYDGFFSASGVSVFAASGDTGNPGIWPSTSPNVISVGGTTLTLNSDGSVTETGWSGSGGGCSKYETATAAQAGFKGYAQVGCAGKRAIPDVSLDANPNTGVAVYDTVPSGNTMAWYQVGGTSVSTPMWAARSADITTGAVVNAGYVYGSAITYRGISMADGGAPLSPDYNLATGRGSWTGSAP